MGARPGSVPPRPPRRLPAALGAGSRPFPGEAGRGRAVGGLRSCSLAPGQLRAVTHRGTWKTRARTQTRPEERGQRRPPGTRGRRWAARGRARSRPGLRGSRRGRARGRRGRAGGRSCLRDAAPLRSDSGPPRAGPAARPAAGELRGAPPSAAPSPAPPDGPGGERAARGREAAGPGPGLRADTCGGSAGSPGCGGGAVPHRRFLSFELSVRSL